MSDEYPGSVATMVQSLAGTDDCNKTFDVTIEKILKYAQSRQGVRYGLYFETGQGSEFTNGVANGVDMMVLESRKYVQQGNRPRARQGAVPGRMAPCQRCGRFLPKGDGRSKETISAEGLQKMQEAADRGVDLATGHGKNLWDLNPELEAKVKSYYDDAKVSLWAELTPEFIHTIPNATPSSTLSKDREDYIAHPPTGERLSAESINALE